MNFVFCSRWTINYGGLCHDGGNFARSHRGSWDPSNQIHSTAVSESWVKLMEFHKIYLKKKNDLVSHVLLQFIVELRHLKLWGGLLKCTQHTNKCRQRTSKSTYEEAGALWQLCSTDFIINLKKGLLVVTFSLSFLLMSGITYIDGSHLTVLWRMLTG